LVYLHRLHQTSLCISFVGAAERIREMSIDWILRLFHPGDTQSQFPRHSTLWTTVCGRARSGRDFLIWLNQLNAAMKCEWKVPKWRFELSDARVQHCAQTRNRQLPKKETFLSVPISVAVVRSSMCVAICRFSGLEIKQ
jgi:hypothetical protein